MEASYNGGHVDGRHVNDLDGRHPKLWAITFSTVRRVGEALLFLAWTLEMSTLLPSVSFCDRPSLHALLCVANLPSLL